MRIVGGRLGGRRLSKPASAAIRPTSDRVREALGSILESRLSLVETRVLDLFGGTGAVSFELLSRGAPRAVSVDHDRKILAAMSRDARTLGLEGQFATWLADLLAPPPAVVRDLLRAPHGADGPFGLVVADPPYAEAHKLPALFAALLEAGLADGRTLFVLERATQAPVPPPPPLASLASYRYGDTSLDLFSARSEGTADR